MDRPEYLVTGGRAFEHGDVVAAYRYRPPYPASVVKRLAELAGGPNGSALELGCGPGELARALAAVVRRIEAVDPSPGMIEVGRASAGGDRPNLQWATASAEDHDYPRDLSLIYAADSLHWMDWARVGPLIERALAPGGWFAVVEGRMEIDAPWADASLDQFWARHSAHRNRVPFEVVPELERAGLFQVTTRFQSRPETLTQSLDDFIERCHSQAGGSRARLGASGTAAFDHELRELLGPHLGKDCGLSFRYSVSIVAGHPSARS